MRILKIKIHNIASIADAVVDFSGGPLKDEPLFLITGPTGAGKTTILDAMCLALYARTPRMEKVEGREKYESDELTLLTSDNRQLMRRNTTECYAELVFTGNDDVDYRARWSVRRAYGKVDGKLQAQVHVLQNLQTGETFEKSTRVEIEKVIGLRYEQFCRTSMLAQGDFTKFLQSNSNDKSDILEKITGTGIYSSLGKKIYEIAHEKKETLKVLQAKVEGIRVLSVEERLEIENSIAAKTGKIKYIEKEIADMRKRSEWLVQRELLRKQKEDITEKLKVCTAEEEKEEYKAEEALVADYTVASEARVWWTELMSLKADMAKETNSQNVYKTELAGLLSGLYALQENMAGRQKQLEELRRYVHTQEVHKTMFAEYPRIELWFGQIGTFEQDILDNRRKILEAVERRKTLDETLKHALQCVSDKENELRQKQRDIDSKNEVLKQLDFEGLQVKNRELAEKKSCIDRLAVALTLWEEAQRICGQAKDELREDDNRIKEYERQLPLKRQEYADKKKENEKWEETYDHVSLSLKDWAREARHRLRVGDPCPVCGQTVEVPLKDEVFVSALAPVESSRNESREQLKQLNGALIAVEKAYEEITKLRARHAEQYHRMEEECKTRGEAVETACRQCGDSRNEQEDIAGYLKRLQQTNVKDIESVSAALERVAMLNRELSALQGEKDRIARELELQKAGKMKMDNALLALESEKKNLTSHLQRDEEEIRTRIRQIDDVMTWTDWQTQWKNGKEAFVATLKQETDRYTKACEEEQTIVHEISNMTLVLENIRKFREIVLQAIPSWKDLKAEEGASHGGGLSDRWHTLSTDIVQWKQRILSLRESIADKEMKLKSFFEAHAGMDRARLQVLSACSVEQIAAVTERHKQIRNAIVMWGGKLKQVEEQEKRTLANRPQLSETDTVEELERRMAEHNGQTEQLHQSVGAMQQQLKNDMENRKNHEEAIRGQNEFARECGKWDKFCKILGDSEGRTFRNIAQSFILGHLLKLANRYLSQFTDRYRLTYNPGSLIILVEDKYRQAPPQSASILSGGESFMVSLSLALALSGLDAHRSDVDTLFIDEGFGTLDSECLGAVMDTLEKLHRMGGRRVGIISHVEELEERISTKIVVSRSGSSPSTVSVESRVP